MIIVFIDCVNKAFPVNTWEEGVKLAEEVLSKDKSNFVKHIDFMSGQDVFATTIGIVDTQKKRVEWKDFNLTE